MTKNVTESFTRNRFRRVRTFQVYKRDELRSIIHMQHHQSVQPLSRQRPSENQRNKLFFKSRVKQKQNQHQSVATDAGCV